MNLLVIISLTIISAFTSAISALTGMGGGIILLSLMTFFLPIKVIVPIHGLVQLVSNTYRCFLLRKSIKTEILYPFLIGLPFGAIIAIQIIDSFQSEKLILFAIATMITYVVFKPKKMPELKIPNKFFIINGIIVGALGPIIGAVGPLMAPFFIRSDFKKEEIVATKSSTQIFGHLIKIPTFLYLDFSYLDYLNLFIPMIIMTFLGTYLGVQLLKKLNEKIFINIFKTLLFLAALRLYYKVLFA